MIRFTVAGEPKPAGSKSAFLNPKTGRPVVTDSAGKGGRAWRQDVKHCASEAMGEREPLEGPLAVSMTFYRPRPRAHMGTGRNSHLVKPSAPLAPTTRPDLLKLARAVEDACSGIVYADDAQIVVEHLEKAYGMPRVEVLVMPHEPHAADELELIAEAA